MGDMNIVKTAAGCQGARDEDDKRSRRERVLGELGTARCSRLRMTMGKEVC